MVVEIVPFMVLDSTELEFIPRPSATLGDDSLVNCVAAELVSEEEEQEESGESEKAVYFSPIRQTPVDGKPSCAFSYWCRFLPVSVIVFCKWHHRIVARLVLDGKHGVFDDGREDVTIHRPIASQMPRMRELHKVTNSDFIRWSIDIEAGRICARGPAV